MQPLNLTPHAERALRQLMEKERQEEDALPADVRATVRRQALAKAVGLLQLTEREQMLVDVAVERAQRELVEKLMQLGLV